MPDNLTLTVEFILTKGCFSEMTSFRMPVDSVKRVVGFLLLKHMINLLRFNPKGLKFYLYLGMLFQIKLSSMNREFPSAACEFHSPLCSEQKWSFWDICVQMLVDLKKQFV